MTRYILKRLLLIPLTLLGILLINFVLIQCAPGGPVERIMLRMDNAQTATMSRMSGPQGDVGGYAVSSKYQGSQGLKTELVAELNQRFGFDRPMHERFLKMLKQYLVFDLGKSFYRDVRVVDLIKEKMPVSISLGLWGTLLIYLVAIPLGIYKARKAGSLGDAVSSWLLIVGYAIPAFLLAIFLILIFAGGAYFSWFPLRGLVSDNWETLTWWGRVKDYFWHMALPVFSLVVGGFAALTFLTKNSFLEEMKKNYVLTARAKGLTEKQALYRHVFRNAMLIIIAGFPATLIGLLFAGSVLIEVIFSLDGLGLLGYESVLNRDYPVIFGSLYIFTLLGLVLNLISDLTYHLVDPRIDFERKKI